ncbi:hypothetical protein ElyMa_000875300 [Elysia marginata]|uniref:EGF-like domain-containing protein n=1 Tax=Elysia marginata TaxID=1093978 RepID=A0AAV4H4V6_9GAST|nr:hypothetical protein ElyMa_000875300 [Elysia marginata]
MSALQESGQVNEYCEARPCGHLLVDGHVSTQETPPRILSWPCPLTGPSSETDSLISDQPARHKPSKDHPYLIENSMPLPSQTSHQSSNCSSADIFNSSTDPEDVGGSTPSLWARPIRKRLPSRGLALLLFGTFVLVAVGVGVSKIRAKPTLHVVFPAKDVVRKVRMFSDFPDLSRLSKNHSSLSLVSRLQLLDTKRCRDQLHECKVSIVCDPTTRQATNCRCRTGYYFKNWQCHGTCMS